MGMYQLNTDNAKAEQKNNTYGGTIKNDDYMKIKLRSHRFSIDKWTSPPTIIQRVDKGVKIIVGDSWVLIGDDIMKKCCSLIGETRRKL